MKIIKIIVILGILAVALNSSASAGQVATSNLNTTESTYPGGKKKKNKRVKRKNKKRKAYCHRAARRNFAG